MINGSGWEAMTGAERSAFTAARMTDDERAEMAARTAGWLATAQEDRSRGGHAAAARMTPEERSERARRAARASHSPVAHARALAAAWDGMSPSERGAVLAVLAPLRADANRHAAAQVLALVSTWADQ